MVNRIDVKLDRKAFQVVLGTFSFMRDHWGMPGIVDPAAIFITRQDVAEMVRKLEARDQGGGEVTIPMNFDDWVVYGALLSQVSSNVPQSDPDASEILEALWDEVGRRDGAGEAPNGPESNNK